MSDEILVVGETELLLVGGGAELLTETAQQNGDLLEVAQQGPPGPPGAAGPQGLPGTSISSYVAATGLQSHIAVVLNSAGQVLPADATTRAHFALAGVTVGSAASGTPVTVVTAGVVEHGGWAFIVGAPVFLGLAGTITQTLPDTAVFSKVLGVAVSPTHIAIDFQPAIFK